MLLGNPSLGLRLTALSVCSCLPRGSSQFGENLLHICQSLVLEHPHRFLYVRGQVRL
jgi:hypothetical protein